MEREEIILLQIRRLPRSAHGDSQKKDPKLPPAAKSYALERRYPPPPQAARTLVNPKLWSGARAWDRSPRLSVSPLTCGAHFCEVGSISKQRKLSQWIGPARPTSADHCETNELAPLSSDSIACGPRSPPGEQRDASRRLRRRCGPQLLWRRRGRWAHAAAQVPRSGSAGDHAGRGEGRQLRRPRHRGLPRCVPPSLRYWKNLQFVLCVVLCCGIDVYLRWLSLLRQIGDDDAGTRVAVAYQSEVRAIASVLLLGHLISGN